MDRTPQLYRVVIDDVLNTIKLDLLKYGCDEDTVAIKMQKLQQVHTQHEQQQRQRAAAVAAGAVWREWRRRKACMRVCVVWWSALPGADGCDSPLLPLPLALWMRIAMAVCRNGSTRSRPVRATNRHQWLLATRRHASVDTNGSHCMRCALTSPSHSLLFGVCLCLSAGGCLDYSDTPLHPGAGAEGPRRKRKLEKAAERDMKPAGAGAGADGADAAAAAAGGAARNRRALAYPVLHPQRTPEQMQQALQMQQQMGGMMSMGGMVSASVERWMVAPPSSKGLFALLLLR